MYLLLFLLKKKVYLFLEFVASVYRLKIDPIKYIHTHHHCIMLLKRVNLQFSATSRVGVVSPDHTNAQDNGEALSRVHNSNEERKRDCTDTVARFYYTPYAINNECSTNGVFTFAFFFLFGLKVSLSE